MTPSRERLRALKEALLLGDPVDDRLRFELVGLIESVASSLPNPRGRPADQLLQQRAAVVGVLHENHGVALKAALFAAAPTADSRARASIERIYHRQSASGEVVRAPDRAVRAALAQLGR